MGLHSSRRCRPGRFIAIPRLLAGCSSVRRSCVVLGWGCADAQGGTAGASTSSILRCICRPSASSMVAFFLFFWLRWHAALSARLESNMAQHGSIIVGAGPAVGASRSAPRLLRLFSFHAVVRRWRWCPIAVGFRQRFMSLRVAPVSFPDQPAPAARLRRSQPPALLRSVFSFRTRRASRAAFFIHFGLAVTGMWFNVGFHRQTPAPPNCTSFPALRKPHTGPLPWPFHLRPRPSSACPALPASHAAQFSAGGRHRPLLRRPAHGGPPPWQRGGGFLLWALQKAFLSPHRGRRLRTGDRTPPMWSTSSSQHRPRAALIAIGSLVRTWLHSTANARGKAGRQAGRAGRQADPGRSPPVMTASRVGALVFSGRPVRAGGLGCHAPEAGRPPAHGLVMVLDLILAVAAVAAFRRPPRAFQLAESTCGFLAWPAGLPCHGVDAPFAVSFFLPVTALSPWRPWRLPWNQVGDRTGVKVTAAAGRPWASSCAPRHSLLSSVRPGNPAPVPHSSFSSPGWFATVLRSPRCAISSCRSAACPSAFCLFVPGLQPERLPTTRPDRLEQAPLLRVPINRLCSFFGFASCSLVLHTWLPRIMARYVTAIVTYLNSAYLRFVVQYLASRLLQELHCSLGSALRGCVSLALSA